MLTYSYNNIKAPLMKFYYLSLLVTILQAHGNLFAQAGYPVDSSTPLRTVIDSLRNEQHIPTYIAQESIWKLTMPVVIDRRSCKLILLLNKYCRNKLLDYELSPTKLNIYPTALGDSVLKGFHAVFYIQTQAGEPIAYTQVT